MMGLGVRFSRVVPGAPHQDLSVWILNGVGRKSAEAFQRSGGSASALQMKKGQVGRPGFTAGRNGYIQRDCIPDQTASSSPLGPCDWKRQVSPESLLP